ncbi:MAG TPA: hypothetical protein VF434_07335 [Promineifilum sp.]
MSVLANSLWIAGLAVALAATSYHYWLSGQQERRFREQVSDLQFRRLVLTGLLLVAAGMALAGTGPLEVLPAVALMLVCMAALFHLRGRRQHHSAG